MRNDRITGAAMTGVLALLLLPSCGMGGTPAYHVDPQHQESTVTEVVPDVHEVDVSVETGRVTVVSGVDASVELSTHSRSGFWKARVYHRVEDGVLWATADCGGQLDAVCQIEQQVTVPPGAPVRVHVGQGRIEAVGLKGPRLEAQTDAGDIDLAFVERPTVLHARSGAGSIHLSVPQGSYRVDAGSAAGKVSVDVGQEPRAPRQLYAHTAAGDVRISPT
jgi:Putative adhesin